METPSGEQAIGNLKVGDTVLAYNPATGKSEPEPVQRVWRNLDHDLVDVQFTLASSLAAGAPTSNANDAHGTSSATADSVSGATRTAATPTRLHRWVASGVLAAGFAVTLLTASAAATPGATPLSSATTPATTANSETIQTTFNHPWLTTDRGWVLVGDLQVGGPVQTLAGGTATVAAVKSQ